LEDLCQAAMQLAVEVGAVEECEHHDGNFISMDDQEANDRVYAVGTNMVKNGEIGATREEFMEAIKAALAEAEYECSLCARIRDE
jgi:hypothetical protein